MGDQDHHSKWRARSRKKEFKAGQRVRTRHCNPPTRKDTWIYGIVERVQHDWGPVKTTVIYVKWNGEREVYGMFLYDVHHIPKRRTCPSSKEASQ